MNGLERAMREARSLARQLALLTLAVTMAFSMPLAPARAQQQEQISIFDLLAILQFKQQFFIHFTEIIHEVQRVLYLMCNASSDLSE